MSEPGRVADRVTTPLLTLITQQSLDEDYLHVARQRADGRRPDATRRRPAVTLVALAAFALLVTIAAVQTSRDAGVRNEDRGRLIERVEARRTTLDRLQSDLGRLRDGNVAADTAYQRLGRQLDQLTSREAALGSSTGFGVLAGAGVRAVVDDGPGDNEVRDSDLRLLVNGLWEAGARGIAVNGQRVTVLSALRNSGQAIRINDVSLSPPYTIEAVGDTHTLQARFAESTSGARFYDLTKLYGMPFSVQPVDRLSLPAAPARMRTVHYARAASTGPTGSTAKAPRTEKETP